MNSLHAIHLNNVTASQISADSVAARANCITLHPSASVALALPLLLLLNGCRA